MTKIFRMFLVAGMVSALTIGGAAYAQDADIEVGDAEASADQSGTAASGDAVGGQVVGVVSAGDASVDATNLSRDVDIETGDADASNNAYVVAIQASYAYAYAGALGDADVEIGDASAAAAQSANAVSGDGVAGQVAGVVTSAGGSADLVLANTSEEVDVETGDAEFDNEADVASFQFSTIIALGGP